MGYHKKFLVAEEHGGANADRKKAGDWGAFEVIPRGGNKFAFKSHHSKYLVAEEDGSLNANRGQIGLGEEFEVTCNGKTGCYIRHKIGNRCSAIRGNSCYAY